MPNSASSSSAVRVKYRPSSGEPCDDEFMYGTFEHYFRQITGRLPTNLRLQGEGPFESWIVDRVGGTVSPYAVEAADGPVFTRAALANVEESRFLGCQYRPCLLVLQHRLDLVRHARHLSPPFLTFSSSELVDWMQVAVASLAKACDCFAVAVQLVAPGLPFTWMFLDQASHHGRGRAICANALIDKWAAFAVTMGEPPGTVCWPDWLPGRVL